jgi:uncharacterized membrane protein YhaH (DUF805 family)
MIISAMNQTSIDPATGATTTTVNPLSALFMLLFLWTGFAVSAKRYHDRGKAAWWVLIIFVPLIGFF